ncbi:heavy metal-associated domain-containing protein [Fulvivirga sp.]|uniref:heavy-metal-associated domain-containing protein n=1 Tax=Fulvivirga sp. TaxID=1931237 RepID=UPI0032F07E60
MKTSETTINTFPVINMKCAGCASSIESFLKSQSGVKEVTIDLEGAEVTIEYKQEVISPAELKKGVQSIGYDIDIKA